MTIRIDAQSSRYERQLQDQLSQADRLSSLPPRAREVFLRLSILRRHLARDANIPAYQVLSNRVLLALCEQQPQDLPGLTSIPGFAPTRVRAYGAEILSVLRGAWLEPSRE